MLLRRLFTLRTLSMPGHGAETPGGDGEQTRRGRRLKGGGEQMRRGRRLREGMGWPMDRAVMVRRLGAIAASLVMMVVPLGAAACSAAPKSGSTGAATAKVSWWKPKASASLKWQIQFTGTLDLSTGASVYDLDGDGTSKAQVAALHKKGTKVICYVSGGSYEDWRADAKKFPAAVLGKGLDGWPGEKWLDVRRWDVLGPIMRARFESCRAKGFDAVDPDNLDGYANDNGLGLTAGDQLTYNKRLAALAHGLGMGVGLKNDLDQVAQLVSSFDFSVNEQCAYYKECSMLTPFVKQGKPVFEIEYEVATGTFCPQSRKLGFSAIRKRLALDAWRQTC
jgi:hypothetical protein